jgi:hypothetical protein
MKHLILLGAWDKPLCFEFAMYSGKQFGCEPATPPRGFGVLALTKRRSWKAGRETRCDDRQSLSKLPLALVRQFVPTFIARVTKVLLRFLIRSLRFNALPAVYRPPYSMLDVY